MKCELCSGVQGEMFNLPMPQKNGKSHSLACEFCVSNSRFFCRTHRQMHMCFKDGSSACLICIEELVSEQDTLALCSRIAEFFPTKIWGEICEFAEEVPIDRHEGIDRTITRFFVTKAKRMRSDFDFTFRALGNASSRKKFLFDIGGRDGIRNPTANRQ